MDIIKNLDKTKLEDVLKSLPQSKIMVIGDIMLDEYLWGNINRISPEAPVPIVEIERISHRLGGAANVVQNLVKLGVNTTLISIRGDDSNGETLTEMLKSSGCNCGSICVSRTRPTTIKTRIIAGNQQVIRSDRETTDALDHDEIGLMKSAFDKAVDGIKAIIISDYGKGVVCEEFLKYALSEAKKRGIFISVDPKEKHFDLYRMVDVITPNLKEAHVIVNKPFQKRSLEEIIELGWDIVNRMSLKFLLLTLSERGMMLFDKNENKCSHLPTVAQSVFDVTGAGDTVISVFSAAMASGASPVESAYISNHAAGITIGEIGTSSVDLETLSKACLDLFE